MNKQRRGEINKLVFRLGEIAGGYLDRQFNEVILSDKIQGVRDEIEEILAEEVESYDNMPEGIQQSERGEASEEAQDALDNAETALDTLAGELADSGITTDDERQEFAAQIEAAAEELEHAAGC